MAQLQTPEQAGKLANGKAVFTEVLAFVQDKLNECNEFFSGTCWEREKPGRGYIVWNDDRADCSDSVVFPAGFNLMHRGVLIVCYALFFIWLFFGIAICSDIFSEAIENITSTTKKVIKKHPRTGESVEVEVPVWNWVVANISLMAFGTSAPEILLSVVETLTQLGAKGGQLGASTIVGSAAYNYFLIPGICTLALPPGEFRKLEHIYVFICTAIWSVWAYIWMFIVLAISSPNEVEIWEGFVTLAFFPLMLITAYAVDKKPWEWRRGQASDLIADWPYDLEEAALENGTMSKATSGIYDQRAGSLVGGSANLTGSMKYPGKQKHSILHYRMMSMRRMAGESKTPEMLAYEREKQERGEQFNHDHPEGSMDTMSGRFVERQQREAAAPPGTSKLGFSSMHYSVLEAQGVARILVRRYEGDLDMPLSVSYATKDGTAIAGLDYQEAKGQLDFGPGEVLKEVEIKIIDDDMSEPDVTFTVVLSDVKGVGVFIVQESVPVTIVDDDDGGMIMFELPTKEASTEDEFVDIPVIRRNGSDGRVTAEYTTEDGTGPAALAGEHFETTRGTIVFEHGETRAKIRIPLTAAATKDMLVFKAQLSNPLGGAVLGKRAVCRVILVPGRPKTIETEDDNTKGKGKGGSDDGKSDGSKKGDGDDDEEEGPYNLWEGYYDGFKEAVIPELEDGADNIWYDLLLHYTSVTWKVICAFVPPCEWKNSYPAFWGSLVVLVGIIFITKEVGNVLGCELTLSPTMTGLALVALGTSLPDTFASRMAAIHDDTADAAIGNITGSNSTNVFLGLGLPWIIASGYYYNVGVPFTVLAGDLGFTLVLWCAGFGAMSIVLAIRRFQGGELGGSLKMQRILMGWSAFLWVFFLVLSGVVDYNHFDSNVSSSKA